MAARTQIADIEVAREFWSQISVQIDDESYSHLERRLAAKAARVKEIVHGSRDSIRESANLRFLLDSSFASRRKAKEILATVDPAELANAIAHLSDESVGGLFERVQPLRSLLDEFVSARDELPFELLHNLHPDEYWPWSRWIWNSDADTGALRLLVSDEADLFGDDEFDTYGRVCQASTYLFHTLAAAGLGVDMSSPFSFDIFLAGVYATYMSTVLEMRMTREFNQIVPQAVELCARLLGVYKLEVGI